MRTNLIEQYGAALEKLGERKAPNQRSTRFVVYTRAAGGFYWLGRSGALRVGHNARTSRPAAQRFKDALLASLKEVALSDRLKNWFDNFSQSAAIDMCEGGDDKEAVAETCMTVLSCHSKDLYAELQGHIDKHGLDAVKAAVMKTVRTL